MSAKKPLILLGLLLAAGIAVIVYREMAAAAERSRQRDMLLAEAERMLSAPDSARSEWSNVVARLQQFDPEHLDPGVRLCLARIDLARGRPEVALDALDNDLAMGDASLPVLRAAAEARLLLHARDGSRSQGLGALRAAEQAAGLSQEAGDLLLAWQAAWRLPDPTRTDELGKRLQAEHAGSGAAMLAALAATFDQSTPAERVHEVAAKFTDKPLELELFEAILLLTGKDSAAAVEALGRLLQRAPGVAELRHWAAAANAFLAQENGVDPAVRSRCIERVHTHADWLLRNGPEEDPRRAIWQQMAAMQ